MTMADNDFAYRQEDAEKRRRRREAERQRRLRHAREEYIKKKNEDNKWIGSIFTEIEPISDREKLAGNLDFSIKNNDIVFIRILVWISHDLFITHI